MKPLFHPKNFRNKGMQAIYIWRQNGTYVVYQIVLFWNFLQNFDIARFLYFRPQIKLCGWVYEMPHRVCKILCRI